MIQKICILICAILTPGVAVAASACRGNPEVIGACFAVHGRLSYYNGNPSFRIWPVSSKRLLGVLDDERPIVPINLRPYLATDTKVYGDFLVCPFTPEKAGAMQMVCVESAEHLVPIKAERRKVP